MNSVVLRDAATLNFRTLGRMIEETARRWPQRPAVIVDKRPYTYASLIERAQLFQRGFDKKGKFCGLFGRRDFPIFAGIAASLIGGRTYVPISCDDPQERQLEQIRQVALDLVIADASHEARLRTLLGEVEWPVTVILAERQHRPDWCQSLSKHRFLALADLERAVPVPAHDDNPDAYLLFTSGSTGKPKGVLVSHANVLSYVANFVAIYGVTETDRFSQLAPLGFDFSVHDIFVPWRKGAVACVFEGGDAFGLAREFVEQRVTVCGTVPSTVVFLNRLNSLSVNQFTDLRVTVFCGEPLSEQVARQWQRAAPSCRIDNIYGPTETTVAVTYYRWDARTDEGDRVVPIGWAFDGVRLRVADIGGDEVAPGDIGELWIAGDQVAREYWGSPELTADRFVHCDGDRWYRTGDLVRSSMADGLLYVGRADNQFQVMGQRVDRLEVETLLRKISQAQDVAVLPWPINRDNIVEGLAFFVEGCPHQELALRQLCRKFMPKSMWPGLIIMGEIPKNRNGKTNYQNLKTVLERMTEAPAEAVGGEVRDETYGEHA